MKRLFWYLLFLASITAALILPGRLGYVSKHPTLNAVAEHPDIHFKNVSHYIKAEEWDRSARALDKAIESIQRIEKDVNEERALGLKQSIVRLNQVKQDFSADSIDINGMFNAFEYTMNQLAQAELEASKIYAEENQKRRVRLALRHARSHIRNAVHFRQSNYVEDSSYWRIELHVLDELDSLIANEFLPTEELTLKINNMINEVDLLLVRE